MDSAQRAKAARLRLVWVNRSLEDRKYAQSTSGRVVSHGTLPSDSRSIEIDKDSPQVLSPYATLRKWPTEVPHRWANDSRCDGSIANQNDFRSIRHYHHTVTFLATPIGEFTQWCLSRDNRDVPKEEIRRANTRRLVQIRFGGNKSAFSRTLGHESTSYVNDLLSDRGKSFAEKAARSIEQKVGLLPDELDIPESPLRMDPSRIDRVSEDLDNMVYGMSDDEKAELLNEASRIIARRKKRRRRG